MLPHPHQNSGVTQPLAPDSQKPRQDAFSLRCGGKNGIAHTARLSTHNSMFEPDQ